MRPIRQIFPAIEPSPANALEFCQGTIAEMNGEMDVYEAIETYSKTGRIAYVHFRNVRGKVPEYHEVFLDEGDVDMVRALRLYLRNGYDGVIIPDHTPQMACAAPCSPSLSEAPSLSAGSSRSASRHASTAAAISPADSSISPRLNQPAVHDGASAKASRMRSAAATCSPASASISA